MTNAEHEERIAEKIKQVKDIFVEKINDGISKCSTANQIEEFLDGIIAGMTRVK